MVSKSKIIVVTLLVVMTNLVSFFFGKFTTFFAEYLKFLPCAALVDISPSNVLISDPPVMSADGLVPYMLRGSLLETSKSVTLNTSHQPRIAISQPSPHLWNEISIVPAHVGYKKILVTGGAGFIGSHVTNALLQRGDDVVVVDEVNDFYDVTIKETNLKLLQNISNEGNRGRLTIYRGDINDHTLMTEVFEAESPPWICHLAARAGVRPSINDPLLYIQANVQGTTNILEYSRAYNVRNVVLASSSSVYGESKSTFFSEAEDVNKPVSPYAATKRSGEMIAYTYHNLYGLNVTNLRFFTVYGPRGRPDMAPYKFISSVTSGESIDQYGDGSSSRDYTYIDDIVDGVVRAIDRPYPYEIINLGKGSGTKLSEFIAIIEKHVGKKASINYLPAQPGDVPFTNADVSKAHRLLGYKSKVTIDEGVMRTVSWYNSTIKGHAREYSEDIMRENR